MFWIDAQMIPRNKDNASLHHFFFLVYNGKDRLPYRGGQKAFEARSTMATSDWQSCRRRGESWYRVWKKKKPQAGVVTSHAGLITEPRADIKPNRTTYIRPYLTRLVSLFLHPGAGPKLNWPAAEAFVPMA